MKKRILSIILTVLMLISAIPTIALQAEDPSIVTNGLVAHYDGKQNTKAGHDANATVWEDLAGDNDVTVAKNANSYFTEDAFYLSKAQYNFPKALLNLVNSNAFTVELSIGDFTLHGSGYATIINNSGNDNFAFFVRKSNDVLEFKNGSNGRPMVQSGSDAMKDSTITVTFEKGKVCSVYVDGICKAQTVPTANIGADGNLFFGHADASRSHTTEFKSIRFYNRALTEAEVVQNAKADGHFDSDYVPPLPFVDVKQPKTNIIGDIAFIEELKSDTQLGGYQNAETLPATLILDVNASLEVTGEKGEKIGTLADVLAKMEGIIPAFRPKDGEAAKAIAEYTNGIMMEDAFVVSSDPMVIKAAREGNGMLRGVLDLRTTFASQTPDNETILKVRSTVSRSSCRVAILPSSFSDREVIDTLNDLQVTTWLASKGSEDVTDMLTELLSGAYGIVTDNTAAVYRVASGYLTSSTLTRTLLNVGHRGYPKGQYPENSLQGAMEAYEMGADAIELDIYLTRDNKIVINHDGNTNAMFDKNISVEGSSLAQLKALNFKGTNLKIPTLEEYFKVFKGKDVLMVIEIKSSKPAIVGALKELMDKYDMYGQSYVIGYFKAGVFNELMDVMPEVPIGYLTGDSNGYTGGESLRHPLKTVLPYNATWNPSYSTYKGDFVRNAVMRGLMTSPYTINDANALYTYLSYGHTAVTTDYCNIIGALNGKITLNLENAESVQPGSSLNYSVSATTWSRKDSDVTGAATLKVIEGEDLVSIENGKLTFGKQEGKVVLLASYSTKMGGIPYTLYDQPIVIDVKAPEPITPPEGDGSEAPPADGSGNAGENEGVGNEGTESDGTDTNGSEKDEGSSTVLIIVIAAVGILAIGAIVFFVLKKKK
ncbi:MAG: hypothetical protein E7599_01240 [Ruminococcaceae bacterium]|nr:hypothetical protein [Oscillospiraceae bacterium]